MPQDNSPLDLTLLIENACGDDDFIKEMCGMFVTQGAGYISRMKDLCTEGDSPDWVEIAHALKGSAGHMGAAVMRQHCAQAQDMRVATAQGRKAMLEQIERDYIQAVAYLAGEKLYTPPHN